MGRKGFAAACRDRGSPLLGSFLTFNTPCAAQILSRCGFDWLMIDMERSPLSAQEATNMVHATISSSQGTCMPLIRVPSHGVEWIRWAIDSGPHGIIIPMVNNKEEIGAIIKRAMYPSGGHSSSGLLRTPFTDLDPKSTATKHRAQTINDVAVFPMIESMDGVKNAEAIMTTNGVSGLFISPPELRSSMNLTGVDGDEEEYEKALRKILDVGKRLGKPVGILMSQTVDKKQIKMGFDFFLMTGDADLLAQAAKSMLSKAKTTIEKVRKNQTDQTSWLNTPTPSLG